MVVWLMGWPAGLKLNNHLDTFMGELFLWLIAVWTSLVAPLVPYLPDVVQAVGMCGVMGATLPIALLDDLLSLATAHIYVFYVVAARIYNWQWHILFSLFQLFRGKKRNVLRRRLDKCDYDLDQLLLGTVLFTLLAFLFPTVAVYYLLFATVRACIGRG